VVRTQTEPSYDDMTVKLRCVIIAARFRSPCGKGEVGDVAVAPAVGGLDRRPAPTKHLPIHLNRMTSSSGDGATIAGE
jgi:hypothetical protein